MLGSLRYNSLAEIWSQSNGVKARISITKGADRYGNVREALHLVADDLELAGKQRVLIKPNLCHTTRQLPTTHVDAVRAVLDFLRERGIGRVTIAEGTGEGDTADAFRNMGYLRLKEDYEVEFVNLNADKAVMVPGYDYRLRPLALGLARTVVESDFRISVCPPKTHDVVVVTLALKNLLVGSLVQRSLRGADDGVGRGSKLTGFVHKVGPLIPLAVKNMGFYQAARVYLINRLLHSSKLAIHQGYPGINLNLYTLARVVPPHLSVIDACVGMEGMGPYDGQPVELNLALAGGDFVAADAIAASIMGFGLEQIGYLWYCAQSGLGVGDISRIEIVGAGLPARVRPSEPHSTFSRQLNWKDSKIDKLVFESPKVASSG